MQGSEDVGEYFDAETRRRGEIQEDKKRNKEMRETERPSCAALSQQYSRDPPSPLSISSSSLEFLSVSASLRQGSSPPGSHSPTHAIM